MAMTGAEINRFVTQSLKGDVSPSSTCDVCNDLQHRIIDRYYSNRWDVSAYENKWPSETV